MLMLPAEVTDQHADQEEVGILLRCEAPPASETQLPGRNLAGVAFRFEPGQLLLGIGVDLPTEAVADMERIRPHHRLLLFDCHGTSASHDRGYVTRSGKGTVSCRV